VCPARCGRPERCWTAWSPVFASRAAPRVLRAVRCRYEPVHLGAEAGEDEVAFPELPEHGPGDGDGPGRGQRSVLVDTAAEAADAPAGAEDAAVGDIPLLAWACAHGLVVLVRGGALQTLTGVATPDQATALAHRLADTFTKIVPT
jgi:hypothetical protein